MPKRTNDFQQLMHYIYSQMAPEGAIVTESASLGNSKREVDILIEHEIVGTKLRIAVECRDRSRKDDVEWIDHLVGKFKDLDVHKVIAVSKSGFSQKAIEKAIVEQIDTCTLEQALNTNWSEEFIKLGIAAVTQQVFVEMVQFEFEPPITQEVQLLETVTDQAGNIFGTLDEVVKDCFNHRINDLREYLSGHFREIFKVLADFDKPLLTEHRIITPTLCLTDTKGVMHRIQCITFHTRSIFTVDQSKVENYLYNKDKVGISTGVIGFKDSDVAYTFNAVQVAGKNQATIFIKRGKEKKKG